MKISHTILLFIIVVTTFITGGCTSSQTTEYQKKVRIAHFPNITHAQALLARADDRLQKAFGDTQIEWKVLNAGPELIEAFLAGEVDIGYIGPGPAVNGYVKSGGELQIIAGVSTGGSTFVSKKGTIIKDLKELAGKKIAIPQFGNTQDLLLRKLLHDYGLKDTTKGGTVEVLQAKNPDIKTLLDNRQIDAALVPEPWGSILINEVAANIILESNQFMKGNNYASSVLIVRKSFLEANPDVVEKFLRTHVELTQDIYSDTRQKKLIINNELNKLTKRALHGDILDAAFKRIGTTYDPHVSSINDLTALSVKLGYIKIMPDTNDLFNLQLLNKVLMEKGLTKVK